MFSIFSNILRDRIRLICQACDRRPHTIEEYKLSDTVDLITPGDNIPQVIIPYDETEDWTDKILYEYCKNQSLRKVTQFVTDKILVDCDKMDYLLRDAHYCGVTYGKYDLNRFVSTLTAYKLESENTLQLAIERGGVQALEEFVLARYFMFIQVYFHKTRRFLDKALVSCLKEILPNGKYPDDVNDYVSWDDNRVLSLISSNEDEAVKRFRKRDIMTCVYESKAHAEKSDGLNVKMIFNFLYKEFGDNILLDSVDKAAHKLSPALLSSNDDSGKGIMIVDDKTKNVTNIMEESIILGSIIRPISIKRIYAKKSIADDVVKKIKEIQN